MSMPLSHLSSHHNRFYLNINTIQSVFYIKVLPCTTLELFYNGRSSKDTLKVSIHVAFS